MDRTSSISHGGVISTYIQCSKQCISWYKCFSTNIRDSLRVSYTGSTTALTQSIIVYAPYFYGDTKYSSTAGS